MSFDAKQHPGSAHETKAAEENSSNIGGPLRAGWNLTSSCEPPRVPVRSDVDVDELNLNQTALRVVQT